MINNKNRNTNNNIGISNLKSNTVTVFISFDICNRAPYLHEKYTSDIPKPTIATIIFSKTI